MSPAVQAVLALIDEDDVFRQQGVTASNACVGERRLARAVAAGQQSAPVLAHDRRRVHHGRPVSPGKVETEALEEASPGCGWNDT